MPLPTKFRALMKKKVAGIPVPVLAAGAGVVGVLAYRRYAGGGATSSGGAFGDTGSGDAGSAAGYSGGTAGGGGGEESFGGGGGGGDFTIGPGGAFIPETAGVAATAPIIRNVTRIIKRQRIKIGKKVVYRRKPGRKPRIVVQNRVVVNNAAAKAAKKRGQVRGRNEGRPIASMGGRRPNTPPIIRPHKTSKAALRPKRRKGQSQPIIRTGK